MKTQHRGQVALILVLIMTVVSALAVSVASRSTVDTRIQQTESQGIQALLFAQTGLEQLVIDSQSNSIEDLSYSASRNNVGMESYFVDRIGAGNSLELSLVGADFDSLSGFSVFWKPENEGSGNKPAIVVSLINSSGAISDYAYDYTGENGFLVGLDGSEEGYDKRTPKIGLSSSILKVRLTVYNSNARLKIVPLDSGASFPPQISSIRSVGSVVAEDATVKYGLKFDESSEDSVPAVFDYALFSDGSITH